MRIVSLLKSGFILLLFGILFSCKENTPPVDLLHQAQNMVESDPAAALVLLDSITSPEKMDKDGYMQYVVSHLQARYKMKEDISSDTTIFEAQKYFEGNNNEPNKTALANLYTAAVYYEQKMPDKALEYYFKAKEYAQKAGNNMLTARSLNNIAFVYFERDLMDKAIFYYRQSLEYYNKVEGHESDKLLLFNYTCITYDIIHKPDSVSFYANKGLKLALEMDNQKYQAAFKHLLGIALCEKGEYKKSAEYIHSSLALTINQADSLRRYISLAILYNDENRLDSAKYYVDLVKKHLSETTSDYALKNTYMVFAEYSARKNDYQEAMQYLKLEKEADQRISEANNSQKLLNAEKKYRMWLDQKEADKQQMRLYLYLLGAAFLLLLTITVFYLRSRSIRNKHRQVIEKNKLLNTQNTMLNQKAKSLVFLQGIYRNVANEWGSIDKEVKALAREYNTEEKPAIYIRIENMVESLKQKTNEQLIEWAKDYLREQDFNEKITIKLNNKDLLLLVLFCSGYSKSDIASTMGIPERKVYPLKLTLKHKLLKTRLTEKEIEEILFDENDQYEI